MAVTQQHQPPETQINGTGHPSISPTKPPKTTLSSENPVSKRFRRPSVRLGEIGDTPAAALTVKPGKNPNRPSKTRPVTNLDNSIGRENVQIGGWKIKKLKRPRTNWGSRVDDLGDGFVRDSETEQSLVNSVEIEKDLNFRVRVGEEDLDHDDDHDGGGHDLDVPSDNNGGGGGQSVRRRWGRDNSDDNDGVRVWLSGLGLGRYWPVFKIHEVDEEVLPLLTLEDLKDMGINAVGSRRKMFCAIQKLSEVFS